MEHKRKCPYVEGCPVYKYFNESTLKVLKILYCHGKFERCERKKRREAGEKVPEKLLPDGTFLGQS